MGQLWAEDRLTLQLHQQKLTSIVKGFLQISVLLPLDSEIVAPISVRSPSGVRLGSCSLVEPSRGLAEEYGVVVGHTLVDVSSWSASVLMHPNAEEIVLPSFACVGDLVPVPAVSVTMAEPSLLNDMGVALPDRQDTTLTTVWDCVQSGEVPAWSDCSGLSPELWCWRLQIGNLSVDTEGR